MQGFIASDSTVCVARSTATARIRRGAVESGQRWILNRSGVVVASVLLHSPHPLWPSIDALILVKRKALDCTDTQNHYPYNMPI
ncbi:hypothetical protein AHAS_Ahas16G0157000 [Arachis hypogaea]